MAENSEERDTPSILLDPALLYKIKQIYDSLIIGENKNKLLLFVVGLTSFMEKPLGAIITGESSAGKSYLMEKVLQYFPNVEEYTRMTEASPDRLGQDFSNKILKVGELLGAEKAQSKLRVWISEGKRKLLTTCIDKETGKISTETIETSGVPCFVTTTTKPDIDTELLNRLMIFSIDETKAQTRRIVTFEAKKEFMSYPKEKEENNVVTEILNYLAVSPFYHVLIPYAEKVAEIFPVESVKARRDFKKLMYVTTAVAFLYQKQRRRVRHGASGYVIAQPADFFMAWQICDDSLLSTCLNLHDQAMKVLGVFKVDVDETATSVAAELGKGQDWARKILNVLVERGYLLRFEKERPYKYRLSRKPDDFARYVDYQHVLGSFGEKETESFLDSLHGDVDIGDVPPISKDYVHPLTGEVVSLAPSISTSQDLLTEQEIELKKEKKPKTSRRSPSLAETTDLSAKQAAEQLKQLREMTQKRKQP